MFCRQNTKRCDKFLAAEHLLAVGRSEGELMGEAPRAAGGASSRGC